jgi:hypothetical protein
MKQKNSKFIATCKFNTNNIPAVVENSTMCLATTFTITVNYCASQPATLQDISTIEPPEIETKTYTVYNFTDQNGEKNINIVVLHDNLVLGFVYLTDDEYQDDFYFDDLQMAWLQSGLIELQDPSILSPIEQQIGLI